MVTLDQVAGQVMVIDQRIESIETANTQRREVDDERFAVLSLGQREVLDRVGSHGTRTTALETKWAAFFGDEGAFKVVMEGLKTQGQKIDRLTWIVACGIGGLAVVQFAAEFFLRKP